MSDQTTPLDKYGSQDVQQTEDQDRHEERKSNHVPLGDLLQRLHDVLPVCAPGDGQEDRQHGPGERAVVLDEARGQLGPVALDLCLHCLLQSQRVEDNHGPQEQECPHQGDQGVADGRDHEPQLLGVVQRVDQTGGWCHAHDPQAPQSAGINEAVGQVKPLEQHNAEIKQIPGHGFAPDERRALDVCPRHELHGEGRREGQGAPPELGRGIPVLQESLHAELHHRDHVGHVQQDEDPHDGLEAVPSALGRNPPPKAFSEGGRPQARTVARVVVHPTLQRLPRVLGGLVVWLARPQEIRSSHPPCLAEAAAEPRAAALR
eukprot:CAMPEP_0175341246 /NCGR_PEP_ID=MMETSP0095-20121207/6243_1 /TAXON_ID=311494 /ORGANISM="Alexandrium monilatum, Strain CCMP3105" /LENGTH=317 /DNA_ID=CAMNT_0016638657 /DNA_START=505 /DNA_END=1455 /DNA_ORIENTATION=+